MAGDIGCLRLSVFLRCIKACVIHTFGHGANRHVVFDLARLNPPEKNEEQLSGLKFLGPNDDEQPQSTLSSSP
jgi:hypothetical protein